MKNIKKIIACVFLAVIIAVSCFSIIASAELTATARIGCSNTNPKVGDTITVTAIYSANEDINAIQGTLSFDSDILEYQSGQNCNLIASNKVKVAFSGPSASTFNFAISFKVKAAGTSSVYLGDGYVANANSEIPVADQSIKVVVLTGNEGQTSTPSGTSSNANLTSLRASAGALSPAFNSNITEYTVTVPYDKTDGILYCTTADNYAKISIAGDRELKVGTTKRSVTVTAPDGTKKTYYVTFKRLAENEEETPQELESITVNNTSYDITDDYTDLTLPKGFSVGIIKYNDKEYSCLASTSGSYNLVCLKEKETQERKFFLFVNNSFEEFKYIENEYNTFIVLDLEAETLSSAEFFASSVEINGFTVPCYKYTDQKYKDFAVLSMESATGEKGYYRYDTVEKSLQRFSEFDDLKSDTKEPATVSVNTSRRNLIVILAFLAAEILIAVIVLAIVLIIKSVKAKKEYEAFEDITEIDQ